MTNRASAVPHHPTIVKSGTKFNLPTMSYHEYKYDSMSRSIYRDPKADPDQLEDLSYIELILNPCSTWLQHNKNWARLLINCIHRLKSNAFGENINFGFFEKCTYWHMYLNVPHQVYHSKNWHIKTAEFIRAGLHRCGYTGWSYRDILAVKKWNRQFPNRISCFISGHKPSDSPTYFQWGCSPRIQLRTFQDENNETQQRMFALPKCWNCFEIGHNGLQCPEVIKARYQIFNYH